MAIVTAKDFDFHFPDWIHDPAITDDERKKFQDSGLADPYVIFGKEGMCNPTEFCFFCGEKLTLPMVMWHGRNHRDDADIWLHPNCVRPFCNRLMRDFNQFVIGKDDADAILQKQKSEGG